MEEIVSEGLRLSAHFARPAGRHAGPGVARAARVSRAVPAARPRSATPTRRCAIGSRARRVGPGSRSRSAGPDRRRATSRSTAGSPTCAPRSTRSHARTDVTGVWIAGFRLGGTLAIVIAADDERVRGIATFAAPASLRTWVREPEWFLEYARRTGVLRTPDYPARSRGVDPRDREPRSGRRGRAQSRPGRGCSCTAAPTTSCRSTTRAGSPTRRAATCRPADRRERPAPAAPRPARDRRAARLARPSERLSRR